MNRQSIFALSLAATAMTFSQGVSAAQLDAKLWQGDWHLNAAKSKFESPAKEASETRTYAYSGGKLTMKSSSKDSSGKVLNFSYSAALDGKSYPMVGNPNGDSISITAVGPGELKATSKLKGTVTVETTATVDAGGKHLTLTRKMMRFKGTPTDVLEFDR